MTVETLFDETHHSFPAMRCIHCGEIIDPVIIGNRNRNNIQTTLANIKTIMEKGEQNAETECDPV